MASLSTDDPPQYAVVSGPDIDSLSDGPDPGR